MPHHKEGQPFCTYDHSCEYCWPKTIVTCPEKYYGSYRCQNHQCLKHWPPQPRCPDSYPSDSDCYNHQCLVHHDKVTK